MSEKTSVKNRVIVLTGASSGFGKGAALKFAEAGAQLVLAARRTELIEDLARECEAKGTRAVAVTTDVSKQDDVERLAQQAASLFGHIDIWINNAGSSAIGRFEEIPLADHIQVVQTDLLGAIFGSYFALREFRRRNGGTLINVSSVLGKIPAPYYASYNAAKAGVASLGVSLRQELEENKVKNIRVCTLFPMATDTPFFEHAANYTGHESVPIPPLYDPEKVIDALFHLAEKPEDEVVIGAMGKTMAAAHNLMPGVMEKMMGMETHIEQIKKAPASEKTPGSVVQPSPKGTGVRGGKSKNSAA